MRLGVVPYSNALPLIHGLKHPVFRAPPAQLPALAQSEDILLAPVATAFEDPSWFLLEGMGIGCFGKALSVKLFLKNKSITLRNIRDIRLDAESKTSRALLKVLLHHYYDRSICHSRPGLQPAGVNSSGNPDRIVLEPRDPGDNGDGELLIGDKVFEKDPALPAIDLGEEWRRQTGLPFLFACWMTRDRKTGERCKPLLEEVLRRNLKDLGSLALSFPPRQREHLLGYWQTLRYTVGAREKEGLELFRKLCGELSGRPPSPLKWL